MHFDITQIVVGIIGVLMAVITSILVPWIKTKLTSEQLALLSTLTQQTVQGLEVMMKSAAGSEKKEAAIKELQNQCEKRGMKFDESTISLQIENAWTKLGLDKK